MSPLEADTELFGSVAVVYRVESDDTALQLANDTEFGLGGSVFSTSETRARGSRSVGSSAADSAASWARWESRSF